MVKCGAVVVVVAAALAGCSLDIDLTDLAFKKPVADAAVDAGGDGGDEGAPTCAYFYHCVFDGETPDVEGCKEGMSPEELSKVQAIEKCRVESCNDIPGNDPDQIVNCLLGTCTDEAVACAIGHGTDSCKAFALTWHDWQEGKEECEEDPPLLCVFEFMAEAAADQLEGVKTVYGQCLTVLRASRGRTLDFYDDCLGMCEVSE